MKTYSEKLKDPRWQKRRLQILAKNDFTCEDCGEKERTLHVHHTFYKKDCDPWDYEDIYLKCLCSECHDFRHDCSDSIKSRLAKMDSQGILLVEWLCIWIDQKEPAALNAVLGDLNAEKRMITEASDK